MHIKTNIEIMPEFLEELQKIADDYRKAVEAKDYARADEIVDFHLKELLQEEYEYFSGLHDDASFVYASHSPNAIFVDINKQDAKRNLSSLEQNRKLLESLLFDEAKWQKFSQELKSRGNLRDLAQLVQNAY